MSRRISSVILAALLATITATASYGQDAAKKPLVVFSEAKEEITNGRFELAAELLRDFYNAKPADQDYLDAEAKFGPSAFNGLRKIPRWYDDPRKEAEFQKDILPAMLNAALAANQKLVNDPVRIKRYVANLAGFREEQQFAITELRRSQDVCVPYLIESLRLDTSTESRAGILEAIRQLGPETVPPVLASIQQLPDDLKVNMIRAVARRGDILNLISKTDSNFLPLLWYLSGSPTPAVSNAARELLAELIGPGVERRKLEQELVRAAEPMYSHKSLFLLEVPDPNDADMKNRKLVKVYEYDVPTQSLKSTLLVPSQAEERYGLRFLHWALERSPSYEPAKSLFLALATERGIERAKFADLAKSQPDVYRLLATAPAEMLTTLLTQALDEKRTALAFGLCQILGDRGDKGAAISSDPNRRIPPLAKALNYPDPRVQLAAAVAMLRTPGGTNHGSHARVVEVLARAVTSEASPATSAAHKAVICDPSAVRADEIAFMLRELGYQTELLGTGRDLLQRVAKTSDVDLILIDRHIVNPTLTDLLSRLRSSADGGRRPVMVVASSDNPRSIGVEPMLLRLALLIAATESLDPGLPPNSPFDRRKQDTVIAKERADTAVLRDKAMQRLYEARLARLQRLVTAADFVNTPELRGRMEVRMRQLTYAALASEFDLTPTSAPETMRKFQMLSELLRRDVRTEFSIDNVSTARLGKLIMQLEIALTDDLKKKFESLQARADLNALDIKVTPNADPAVEAQVVSLTRPFPGVKVVREPFMAIAPGGGQLKPTSFKEDIESVYAQDVAIQPRTAAEKKAWALVAIEWLRRIAVGEIDGYDARPAEAALRGALAQEDLAAAAIDSLAYIPTQTAQQAVVRMALAGDRSAALRERAADAAIRNVQANKALIKDVIDPAVAGDNASLNNKLTVLRMLLNHPNGDFDSHIKSYLPKPVPAPAAPKEVEAAPAPGDAPKEAKDPKEAEKKN